MKCVFATCLILAAVASADTSTGASNDVSVADATVTNVYLVSDVAKGKAWTRQAVLATPSNTIMDLSGVFVSTAEAAVHSNEAERISAVSSAAIAGMQSAFGALYAVTGNLPKTAYHVTLSFPPAEAGASLQGYVVKESTDGVVDTQWVWYSHELPMPPVRYVEYLTPAGRSSVGAKWVSWSAAGETITVNGRTWKGCHRCTVTRPQSARNIPALTRQNDTFGGANGFDFGAAIVTVGGRPTRTGYVTNDITGEVIYFNNGVLKTEAKNANEE